MSKAHWTKWQGGHNAINAFSLELGYLITATVQKRLGRDAWEIEVNRKPQTGTYPTAQAAMAAADAIIRQLGQDFLEDWSVWRQIMDRYAYLHLGTLPYPDETSARTEAGSTAERR
jgi:hypothetical protein